MRPVSDGKNGGISSRLRTKKRLCTFTTGLNVTEIRTDIKICQRLDKSLLKNNLNVTVMPYVVSRHRKLTQGMSCLG